MINKLKPKSEFSRNVLTLMTGTTIAQAIPIAISPILTRIYTPEDFGVFALYMSLVGVLSVFSTGQYELAIMIPKNDKDAINIVVLSILIALFVSFILFLIILIFNNQITNLLGNPEISKWLYFIPITVMLTGIYQSFNYWNNRKKKYKRLAISKVVQSGAVSTTNLGMGVSGYGSSGLIIGTVVGQTISTIVLGKMTWRADSQFFQYINKLKIWSFIKRFRKFPMISLPNALIDSFRFASINILIAKFFSIFALGQFSIAWKMVQSPISIIGNSLSQVFFQKITNVKKDKLNFILTQFIIKASLLSFPIFLVLYFFAIDIFMFIFGQEWKLAGEIASIISPWLFLNFLSAPIANIFIVLNKQEIILIISIFYMIVPISILFYLHDFGFIYVLNLITLAMSSILFIFIFLAFIYTRKEMVNDTE